MYIEPWSDINEYPRGHDQSLLAELDKELAKDHELFGLDFQLLARREDGDDILVKSGEEFYTIHLTWTGKPEVLPFPLFEKFDSINKLNARLKADAEAF